MPEFNAEMTTREQAVAQAQTDEQRLAQANAEAAAEDLANAEEVNAETPLSAIESIQVYTYEVMGVSSLLMHNPSSMGRSSGGLNTRQIPTIEEEAENGAYRLEDGSLYFPSMAFRSALHAGASGRRFGRQSARTVIAGSVFNMDSKTQLIDPETGEPIGKIDPETGEIIERGYEINVSRVVVQRAAIHRARPEVSPWACLVRFEIDTSLIQPEAVQTLFNLAGRTVGIGDWRPQKTGPHGRFTTRLLGPEDEME